MFVPGPFMVRLVCGAGCLLALACADKAPGLPGDEKLLAKVGDTRITAYDVTLAVERTFGKSQVDQSDEKVRRNVLDSLVLSRALANARLSELDDLQKQALERRVAVYRDELLVKEYLAEHHPPARVSEEQARRYYAEHPERFGATQTKRYELVASERELSSLERDTALKLLSEATGKDDWQAWAKDLRSKGLPMAFATGRGHEAALDNQLRSLVTSLAPGQTSPVTFVQGRAYLMRVVTTEPVPPAPFEQVRDQIIASLAPLQVKASLEAARKAVLAKAHVDYVK